MRAESRSVLDRPVARICALGVATLAVAALLAIHWDDLFGGETISDPRVAACVEQRTGEIDSLIERGKLDAAQAEDLRARALSFCRSQVKGEGGANSTAPSNGRPPE